ncbi:hypothetical protein [uncultured Kordia sp.]|uniref:hypothetical protein n=1 Tax=uncultured Kordia sp. TaxID=507699 RepID=UPI0026245900|nr:hypothetical protein [uncultured Kordia sp.]
MKSKPIFLGLLVTLFFSVSMMAQNPGHTQDIRDYKTQKGKQIAVKKSEERLSKICSSYKITRKELYKGGTWKIHFTTSCGHRGEVHFRYDGNYKTTIYHN